MTLFTRLPGTRRRCTSPDSQMCRAATVTSAATWTKDEAAKVDYGGTDMNRISTSTCRTAGSLMTVWSARTPPPTRYRAQTHSSSMASDACRACGGSMPPDTAIAWCDAHFDPTAKMGTAAWYCSGTAPCSRWTATCSAKRPSRSAWQVAPDDTAQLPPSRSAGDAQIWVGKRK